MQLNGSTSTLTTLGWNGTTDLSAFADSSCLRERRLVAKHAQRLAGSLANHDYINVGGTFNLNADGHILVNYFGSYAPQGGDVFNLLDWTGLLGINSFNINNGNRFATGGETNTDLILPTLNGGLFWDTSLFQSHGVLVVIPEPDVRCWRSSVCCCWDRCRRRQAWKEIAPIA